MATELGKVVFFHHIRFFAKYCYVYKLALYMCTCTYNFAHSIIYINFVEQYT